MATLSSLPNELLEQILAELPCRRGTLTNLCLLNHHFRSIFEPFLYGDVIIRSASQSHELYQALKKSPHKSSLVRRLTFEKNPPVIGRKITVDDGELVRNMPNLQSLKVDGWRSRQGIWRSIQRLTAETGPNRPLQKLEGLSIAGLPRTEPIWPQSILSLPRLKYLSFERCRLSSERTTSTVTDTQTLPALQLLSFSNFDVDPRTFAALIKGRPCTTIKLAEVFRVKYMEKDEFLGGLSDFIAHINKAISKPVHLKHFIHTDTKPWNYKELCFSTFPALKYLEIGPYNLEKIMQDVTEPSIHRSMEALKRAFPRSLQILVLDIPQTPTVWQLFDNFVCRVAACKDMALPELYAVIWQHQGTSYLLIKLSGATLEECRRAGIEVAAAPFSRIYMDSQGRVARLQDRMQARHEE